MLAQWDKYYNATMCKAVSPIQNKRRVLSLTLRYFFCHSAVGSIKKSHYVEWITTCHCNILFEFINYCSLYRYYLWEGSKGGKARLQYSRVRSEVQAEYRRSTGGVQEEYRRSTRGVRGEYQRSTHPWSRAFPSLFPSVTSLQKIEFFSFLC